jgi:hypothetical protein
MTRNLILLFAGATISAQAQAQSMVCTFLPTNAYFETRNPSGGRNELPANKYCPVRITMIGREVKGEELCPGGIVPKAFKGVVVANSQYPGNVIVLWANETAAEAGLWAISFERREVGVSYAFAAHFTEVGAQWLRCSDK